MNPHPVPPSYRLAAVDALSRGDKDLYRLLASKTGVRPNPVVPTAEELTAYLQNKQENEGWRSGWSALHVCCRLGLRDAVEVVLESGAVDVDRVDANGGTPLFVAAACGHSDVVGLLVETHGANVNGGRPRLGGPLNDMSPLFIAAEKGHTATVQQLLSFAGRGSSNDRRQHKIGRRDDASVLEVACSYGHVDAVQALLSTGADPNSYRSCRNDRRDDESALSVAISIDSPTMVSLLLEYGADPQYRQSYFLGEPHDPTALHTACAMGRTDSVQCVRLLCDAGADVSASMSVWGSAPCHELPLRVATFDNLFGNVAVLLSVGADPFEVDEDEGVPIIDCPARGAAPLHPSMCVLMDSRPSCPWV